MGIAAVLGAWALHDPVYVAVLVGGWVGGGAALACYFGGWVGRQLLHDVLDSVIDRCACVSLVWTMACIACVSVHPPHPHPHSIPFPKVFSFQFLFDAASFLMFHQSSHNNSPNTTVTGVGRHGGEQAAAEPCGRDWRQVPVLPHGCVCVFFN